MRCTKTPCILLNMLELIQGIIECSQCALHMSSERNITESDLAPNQLEWPELAFALLIKD